MHDSFLKTSPSLFLFFSGLLFSFYLGVFWFCCRFLNLNLEPPIPPLISLPHPTFTTMDTQRVSRALATSYAESRERFRKLSTPPTGKHASLKVFLECDYDKLPEGQGIESLAVFIFKTTPSVEGRANEVVWTKALCDTPIDYTMQLARTYHGFAEGIRRRECSFFNSGSMCLWKNTTRA